MKKLLTVKPLLTLLTIMFLYSCSGTPPDKTVKELVKNHVIKVGGKEFKCPGCFNLNLASSSKLVADSTKIDEIEIIKHGKGGGYFLYLVRVKGSYLVDVTVEKSMLNYVTTRNTSTFDKEQEFYIEKDEYGEWVATPK